MGTLGDLLVRMRLDTTGLDTGVNKSKKQLSSYEQFTSRKQKAITASFTRMAGAMGLVVSAGALLRSAITTVRDFDQSVANLASVSGKTREELYRLTQQARDIGAVSAFTAAQVIELQTELAKLGFQEQEILAATKAIGDFSIAVGTTAARAAALAGAAVRSFGLEATDTERIVESLAVATTKSALDFEKLDTALAQVAPVAQASGLSIERTTSLLGVLANRGVDASTSATGLRNILLELAKQGITWEDAMQQINESTNKSATANELFGKRAATVATILSGAETEARKLESSIIGVSGALEEMTEKRLDTLNGRLTLMQSAWEGLVTSIDDGTGTLSQTFKGLIDDISGIIGLIQNFNESSNLSFTLERQVETSAPYGDTFFEKLNANFYENFVRNIVPGLPSYIPVDEEAQRKEAEKLQKVFAEIDPFKAIYANQGSGIGEGLGVLSSAGIEATEWYAKQLTGLQERLKGLTKGSQEYNEVQEQISTLRKRMIGELDTETNKTDDQGDKVKTLADVSRDLQAEIEALSIQYIQSGKDPGILEQLTDKIQELDEVNRTITESEEAVEALRAGLQRLGEQPLNIPSIPTLTSSGITRASAPPSISQSLDPTAALDSFSIDEISVIIRDLEDELNSADLSITDRLLKQGQLESLKAQLSRLQFSEQLGAGISSAIVQASQSSQDAKARIGELREELEYYRDIASDPRATEAQREAAEAQIKSLNDQIAAEKERANVVKQSGKLVINAIREEIKAQLAKAVANAIASAIGKGPLGLILAPVAAAATLALFDNLVPKLASGGVLDGPTLFLGGEYPGASNNPEIVTPERLLRKIMREEGGGRGPVAVEGRIAGEDILLSSERASYRATRTG